MCFKFRLCDVNEHSISSFECCMSNCGWRPAVVCIARWQSDIADVQLHDAAVSYEELVKIGQWSRGFKIGVSIQ